MAETQPDKPVMFDEATARWLLNTVEQLEKQLPTIRGTRHGRTFWNEPPFWARITGSTTLETGRYKYSWVEQTRDGTGWIDLSGGRSGTTTTNFAICSDTTTAAPLITDNTIVQIYFDGSNPDGTARWMFNVSSVQTSFWAKITDAWGIAIGVYNRWSYHWIEQERTATGFQDKPGGRFGDGSANAALNSYEMANTETGIQGNGINHGTSVYPPGWLMRPVRGYPVVRMWVDVATDGSTVYTFSFPNAEEGVC